MTTAMTTNTITTNTITLTLEEQHLFDFFLHVNQKYNLNVVFRVAGGWVRDKLLGKESDDIDIALDTMTGKELGVFLKKEDDAHRYIKEEEGKEEGDLGHTKKRLKLHVIEQNHEQSKHLEVVNIHIFGLDVDIVNLRTEEYADTRIPTVKFGTPLEDAMRRDLTINSLFYNINTGKVEDFTKKGLTDLRLRQIQTPIDPTQTFLDDPLRILRAIRFSITLGFKLTSEIVTCVQTHPEIKQALVTKVTPERRLTELRKMFRADGIRSLTILDHLGIFNVIFDVPLNPLALEEQSNNIQFYLAMIYGQERVKHSMTLKEILGKLNWLRVTNKEKTNVIYMIEFIRNVGDILNLNIDGKFTDHDRDFFIRMEIFKIRDPLLLDMIFSIWTLWDMDKSTFEFIKQFKWIIGMKPLINGHEIQKMDSSFRGKKIKEVIQKCLDLQAVHRGIQKAELVLKLKDEFGLV